MNYLDELNEDQLRAATHSEGYLRVIAGAGSGKTRMLVARYAYLVDAMGIDPASILCVTFTNKAAAEMRSRIRALIGDGHDTSLISTYHGFCVRMLREDADKIFYPTSFQIIDTAAQKDILREIYDELELKLDFASFEKVLKAISDFKADETYVSQMISRDASAGPVDEGILPEIIRRYLARQKRLYLMDFEDLIHFGLYLLRTCPDVREKWQQRLNYVQVDEFQDSSAREMELVDILSGGYGNLMVVGDPDQNIYEWRGSDVSLLVDFDKTHVPTETTTLALNYRSTNAILACANELIRHNKLRIEKDLRPANPGNVGSKPIHYHAKTEEAEATWIAERIHEGVQGGRAYSNYAVLYRASHLSRMIENALVEANIPYEVRGGVAFYRRMEVLDAIAYLKLITRKDDLAFKRIVNKPPRKMGRVRIAKLQEMAKPDEPLVDALARCIDNKTFKGSGAARFLEVLDELRLAACEQPLPEFIGTVLERTGYERYIREMGDMERFDNLVEFKQTAAEFVARYGEEVTLDMYLNHLALQTDDELRQEGDKVKLMTIHASKGLEFPAVFVVGLSEGTFPSSRTVEERKMLGLEEERRLCYVAVTRAQEELYLTDSEGSSSQEQGKLPSRFLFEAGEDNYERIGSISKELREASVRYAAIHTPWTAEASQELPDRIAHPAFGMGEVRRVDEERLACEVWFEKLGQTRMLSLDFVRKLADSSPVVAPEVAALPEVPVAAAVLPTMPELPALSTAIASASPAAPETPTPKDDPAPSKNHVTLPPQFRYAVLTDDPAETNLWKRSDIPHEGWTCTGITDLGPDDRDTCRMCGEQEIRYVHHMVHPDFPGTIDAGRVCAGWMQGDPDAALQRERDVKNRQKRREALLGRKWKTSRKGNSYIEINGQNVVLFSIGSDKWKYAIGNESSTNAYASKEEAALAAFDQLNPLA